MTSYSTTSHVAFISNKRFLGGWLAGEALLPLVDLDVQLDNGTESRARGFGDLTVGPGLQWAPKKIGNGVFVYRAMIDVGVPTGKYSDSRPVNLGNHFVVVNPYHAFTYERKKVELSARLHYLWNSTNNDPFVGFGIKNMQPGQAFHINYATSYELFKNVRLGFNGYWLRQLTNHEINGVAVPSSKERTVGLGPGGTVVVLNGPDGKFVVDTFVAPAWPRLKNALDGLSNAPVKCVIDTHWHFDHTDNNAPLHAAGATVLAHENTKKRMAESHDLAVLYIEHQTVYSPASGLHFDPSPEEGLPQQTFAVSYKLQANGETLALQHVAPAHADSDIYVHFEKADVIQMGDLFFNGMYPFIDSSTGSKITGMIAAADKILSLAGNDTKIVAGHGPLGNKADLAKFRDMLVISCDRVEKLKSAGKSAQEAVTEKPFADLDTMWGKGIINSEQWVQIVYLTI